MAYDAYLYGMILRTNSFLLKGDYPKADTYGEILKKYSLPGGETGTCATVLLSLGRSVKMDGTYMGRTTMPFIQDFYKGKACDLTSLHLDESFAWRTTSSSRATRARPWGSFRPFTPTPTTAGTRRRRRTSARRRSRRSIPTSSRIPSARRRSAGT